MKGLGLWEPIGKSRYQVRIQALFSEGQLETGLGLGIR